MLFCIIFFCVPNFIQIGPLPAGQPLLCRVVTSYAFFKMASVRHFRFGIRYDRPPRSVCGGLMFICKFSLDRICCFWGNSSRSGLAPHCGFVARQLIKIYRQLPNWLKSVLKSGSQCFLVDSAIVGIAVQYRIIEGCRSRGMKTNVSRTDFFALTDNDQAIGRGCWRSLYSDLSTMLTDADMYGQLTDIDHPSGPTSPAEVECRHGQSTWCLEL